MPMQHDTSPAEAEPEGTTGALVDFAQAAKIYPNGFEALHPVSLTIRPGEIVGVVGPSGCGKTTLLRMAAGLNSASSGTVTRSARSMSYVFQEPTLMAWRTVAGNTELTMRVRRMNRRLARQKALDALELVGLGAFADSYPRELSGGMRMRVSLARAIASDPDLMLLDEPFAALDQFTRERMSAEFINLWRTLRFGGMFITHSIYEAVEVSHRVVVMTTKPGRVVDVVDSPSPPDPDPDRPRDRASLDATSRRISDMLAAL